MAVITSKLVIFDLDETLIHATKTPLDSQEDQRYSDYYVYHRPGLEKFLIECSRLFSLAIWSSADDTYVKSIAQALLPTGVAPQFIWGRSECWVKQMRKRYDTSNLESKVYQNIKPLEKIRRMGFSMENLLIVDNSLYKVEDNPGNYVIIKPFVGNPQDTELKGLLRALSNFINSK